MSNKKPNPFADAFADLPIAEDSAFPLVGDSNPDVAPTLGNGVLADPRPKGVTTSAEPVLNAGASADVPVTSAEEEALRELEEKLERETLEGLARDQREADEAAARLADEALRLAKTLRHEEFHVTVKGDHRLWAAFCEENGLKPLFIELADAQHTLQLMCEAKFDPRPLIIQMVDENDRQLFTIVRVKHEVSALVGDEKALYWEAHAKFEGPWRTDRRGVSRDLYRAHQGRWYMTKRSLEPFDGEGFALRAQSLSKPSRFIECEYEACILDTNRALDGGWL